MTKDLFSIEHAIITVNEYLLHLGLRLNTSDGADSTRSRAGLKNSKPRDTRLFI
jgi:hypothetical protein